jgi:NADH:ubiquinone reductase (non-electrogenic)
MTAPRRFFNLKFLTKASVIVGAVLIGDYWVNGDLPLLSDKFRTKLTEKERENVPRVVVLGSGWGALSLLRHLHTDKYDVTLVSPRNYFLFTPLLPAATVGTLETRSIMEPVRHFLKRSSSESAKFLELECVSIDEKNKKIICSDTSLINNSNLKGVEIPYDYLVIAVGADTATFGIKGVRENSIFMRSPEDVHQLRNRVLDCFEIASIPTVSEEEKKRLLSFLVVGGGPAGVEYAAELSDFLNHDLRKQFPDIAHHVNIHLIEALPHILNSFEKGLVDYTEKRFINNPNVSLLTNSKVIEVDPKVLTVQDMNTQEIRTIPYGTLAWVAGNSTKPLIRDLIKNVGEINGQKTMRGVSTDEYLRAVGIPDVYALGDCSYSNLPQTAQVASQQGRYLGRLLNELSDLPADYPNRNDFSTLATKPFHYNHHGNLLYSDFSVYNYVHE